MHHVGFTDNNSYRIWCTSSVIHVVNSTYWVKPPFGTSPLIGDHLPLKAHDNRDVTKISSLCMGKYNKTRQGIKQLGNSFWFYFFFHFLMKVGKGHIHIVAAGGNHQPPPVNDSPGLHETTHIVDSKLLAMSSVPKCRCVGTSIFQKVTYCCSIQ